MSDKLKKVTAVLSDKHLHDDFFGEDPKTITLEIPSEVLGLLSEEAYQRILNSSKEEMSWNALIEIGSIHPEIEKIIVEILAAEVAKRENKLLAKEPGNALMLKTLMHTVANTEVEDK